MKRAITIMAALLLALLPAAAQKDTLRVSAHFTTHVIFSTDVTYADMSNSRSIAAKVIEQNKNMIAVKAREPFSEPCSISALESNGRMWTFVVIFDDSPSVLIVDTRERERIRARESLAESPEDRAAATDSRDGRKKERKAPSRRRSEGKTASTWKTGDAPTLAEVSDMGREVFHIGTSGYGMSVMCENLYSYSDITYMVLSVRNGSGISYSVADATFVIESRRQSRRTVAYDQTIFPRSRHGSLSAGPGEQGKIVYSFDKMTLSKDQVLRIYLYEEGGQRNLVMTVRPSDINKAKSIMK